MSMVVRWLLVILWVLQVIAVKITFKAMFVYNSALGNVYLICARPLNRAEYMCVVSKQFTLPKESFR